MSHDSRLNRLRQFNLTLRVQLEQSEVRVPPINDMIIQLSGIDLVPETALLGPILYTRPYDVSRDVTDTYQILQAALLVPGGLGVVIWDSEEYAAHIRNPSFDPAAVFFRFHRFEHCELGARALLLPHVDALLDQLLAQILPPEASPSS